MIDDTETVKAIIEPGNTIPSARVAGLMIAKIDATIIANQNAIPRWMCALALIAACSSPARRIVR
jgi:hypothetical protein